MGGGGGGGGGWGSEIVSVLSPHVHSNGIALNGSENKFEFIFSPPINGSENKFKSIFSFTLGPS